MTAPFRDATRPPSDALHWTCLQCPASGTTTGTESGADVKHANAEKHGTNAHLRDWTGSVLTGTSEAAVGRMGGGS